ncbi:hypothetical protein MHM88_05675 [Epibacterium sp. MM17-32]|uniref:hypothetical protein n=1 Tax=Epibacterium sp. MM17-32 TaxID=2917734 RepID=UPI001EF5A25E|nr:hypothetical protein [Epibacterium sp. MM17-32]MCG7627288.1 hypothetical protein [Epibacterium sp. MM17-32]
MKNGVKLLFLVGLVCSFGGAHAQGEGYRSQEAACDHFARVTSIAALMRFETGASLPVAIQFAKTSPLNQTDFHLAAAKTYVRDFYIRQDEYFEIYEDFGEDGFRSSVLLRCMLAARSD